MRGWLSSATFAILVNRNAKGWIKAYKGLRQGDPLSLFLFILVVDVLSMIVRAEERGLFEGFLVGRNRIKVSHLPFADDTIFFSKASFEELHSLKLILLVFGRLSRLRINLNKSTLLGINISLDQTARLASLLDCAAFDWSLSYLPLGGNPNSLSFWDPVLDKVSRRLEKSLFVLKR